MGANILYLRFMLLLSSTSSCLWLIAWSSLLTGRAALDQCSADNKQCSSNDLKSTQLRIKKVDRRSELSLHAYIREYEAKFIPVVITDYSQHIIDAHGLSLKTIRRLCGDKGLTPYMYNATSTEWAKMEKMDSMFVHEYLTYFQQESKSPRSEEHLYMFDWVLLKKCPELGRTLTIPKYVVRDFQKAILSNDVFERSLEDAPWPSLFMSPSALRGSGLHVDGGYSSFWMYLSRGKKRWRIAKSKHIKHLGPHYAPDRVTPHLQADLFEPDFAKFPGLAHAEIWEADIGPGDLIIVPSGSAHQVQNLAPSVASQETM